MKIKKRRIFAGMAVILAMIMISGCGSSDNSASVTVPTETEIMQTEEKETDTQTEEEKETDSQTVEKETNIQTEQEETQTQTEEMQQTTDSQAESEAEITAITEEMARGIALADAGVKAEDVTFKKTERDFDDGIEKFEIDFYCGNMDYEYDIDASTGEIISWSQEMEDDKAAGNTQTTKEAQPKSAQEAQGITDTQALDIALAAAGVKKSDITGESVEKEFEDDYGKTIYDVEFHIGTTEYSYDIDPETGNVLSYDIDTDD